MEAEPLTDARVQIHAGGEYLSASVQTADGRWVRIHSGRQPVAEAEQFIEAALGAVPGGAPAVVFVICPGLGYVIEAIGRRAPSTKVIAIEPFPALARAMLARRDWRDWLESGRLTMLVGPDYRGAAEVGRLISPQVIASTSIVELPVMRRECPDDSARARAIARRILDGAQLNAEARRAFAGRYLLNTLRNLPAIAEEGDVAALRGAFAGVPAIVVAAGPSLDTNIPYLKSLQGRAVIIAVDTTLRPLRAAGIQPHIVVAVDPSEMNARHMLGLDDTDGSWLVSEGSIDPRVFPQFAGHVFSFKVSNHQPWAWLRTHGFDRGTLRAWGSVLTTAFDLALDMGCDPVVFAGADLAYPGGVHYCRGTMNEDPRNHFASAEVRAHGFTEALRHHQRVTCVETDVHGQPIESTPQFVQFRDWLVSRAEEAVQEAAGRRILNATGAGILHGAGVVQASLAALPIASTKVDVAARLASAWRKSRDGDRASGERLAATLAGAGAQSLPIDAWLDFAVGTLTSEEVVSCVVPYWSLPPSVTAQPESLTRRAGRRVQFSAAAAGSARIRWDVSRDDGASWHEVPDVSSATYSFVATAADDGARVRARFSNRRGEAVSAEARLTVPANAPPWDVNGDGRTDLLWRNTRTGDAVIWTLDGVARVDMRGLEPFTPMVEEQIVGAADFDGDGKVELLWRHAVTGAIHVWRLHGGVQAAVAGLPSEPDAAWIIVGTVDMHGTGRPGILWQHATTGALRYWVLDGTVLVGVEAIAHDSEPAWRVVATADGDGHGHANLYWRHGATGDNRIWHMDGTVCAAVSRLDAEPDLQWRMVVAVDLNGDGRPDLVWHNPTTGGGRVWFMDGAARIGEAALETVPPEWVPCPQDTTRR